MTTRATRNAQLVRYSINLVHWEEQLSKAVLGDRIEGNSNVGGDGTEGLFISVETYWQTLHWNTEDAGPGKIACERYQDFRNYTKLYRETVEKYDLIKKYVADPWVTYRALKQH